MATSLHLLYLILAHLFSPVVLIYHYLGDKNASTSQRRWAEFFGFYRSPSLSGVILIHASSVGELEAVTPLVERLLKNHPTTPLLITTATNNGATHVKKLFNDRVQHTFLPYDLPFAVNRFFAHFQPKITIIVETEIWPTLFNTCTKNHTPLILVNARLTEKSLQSYLKIKPFVQSVLKNIDLLLAQTSADESRYQALGMDKSITSVSGNIKLDMPIPEHLQAEGLQLKSNLFSDRLVWVIASTHTNEDEIFIRLYKQLKLDFPQLLLLLVPRREKRFTQVKKLCLDSQLKLVSRSSQQACKLDTDVFLLDSVGELKLFYAAADCSFVAGSMTPVGGHNILEPALLGIPVMFGPYMANSQQTVDQMLAAKACIQCKTEADIYQQFKLLMTHSIAKETLINNATRFIQNNRGTVDKTVNAIDRILSR